MWADLLSMAAVGVFAACIVFIMRRTLNRKSITTPRWLMPAAIGVSMITYSIWNEYTWFDRISSSLPNTVSVVGQGERTAFWAPWTFIKPVTVRFIAIDSRNRIFSQERNDLVLTELLLIERWHPTRKVAVAFDCAANKRADLGNGAQISPEGSLTGATWHALEAGSPMLQAACRAPTPS